MARIKGKIPTRDQRNVLRSAGIKDSTGWLYIGTNYVAVDGAKNVSRNGDKRAEMVFVNSKTGEQKSIIIN